MLQREVFFAKVANTPRATDIGTLVTLMELWDFLSKWTSSHDNVLFWHKVYDIRASAARPHHGPVLVPYVRKCLRAIEEVQTLEAKSDG